MHTIETRNPENLFGLWSGELHSSSHRHTNACFMSPLACEVDVSANLCASVQSFQSAVPPWRTANAMRTSYVPLSPACCPSLIVANGLAIGLETLV
jgi:hypothetical protein